MLRAELATGSATRVMWECGPLTLGCQLHSLLAEPLSPQLGPLVLPFQGPLPNFWREEPKPAWASLGVK